MQQQDKTKNLLNQRLFMTDSQYHNSPHSELQKQKPIKLIENCFNVHISYTPSNNNYQKNNKMDVQSHNHQLNSSQVVNRVNFIQEQNKISQGRRSFPNGQIFYNNSFKIIAQNIQNFNKSIPRSKQKKLDSCITFARENAEQNEAQQKHSKEKSIINQVHEYLGTQNSKANDIQTQDLESKKKQNNEVLLAKSVSKQKCKIKSNIFSVTIGELFENRIQQQYELRSDSPSSTILFQKGQNQKQEKLTQTPLQQKYVQLSRRIDALEHVSHRVSQKRKNLDQITQELGEQQKTGKVVGRIIVNIQGVNQQVYQTDKQRENASLSSDLPVGLMKKTFVSIDPITLVKKSSFPKKPQLQNTEDSVNYSFSGNGLKKYEQVLNKARQTQNRKIQSKQEQIRTRTQQDQQTNTIKKRTLKTIQQIANKTNEKPQFSQLQKIGKTHQQQIHIQLLKLELSKSPLSLSIAIDFPFLPPCPSQEDSNHKLQRIAKELFQIFGYDIQPQDNVKIKKYINCVHFRINQNKNIIWHFTIDKIYVGGWKIDNQNNKQYKQGYGKQYYKDRFYYEGFYQNGFKNGLGKLINLAGASKFIYIGQWKSGLRQGYGKYKSNHNITYEGNWMNDQKHGYGIYRTEDKQQYKGQFYEDLRHGKGIQTFQNGDTYQGSYYENKFHGIGLYQWKNQSSYEGGFYQGQRNGKGIWKSCKISPFDKYQGQYKEDMKHGKGTYTWADGTKYKGQFQHDLKHGLGIVYYPNGTVSEMIWKNNQPEQQISIIKKASVHSTKSYKKTANIRIKSQQHESNSKQNRMIVSRNAQSRISQKNPLIAEWNLIIGKKNKHLQQNGNNKRSKHMRNTIIKQSVQQSLIERIKRAKNNNNHSKK